MARLTWQNVDLERAEINAPVCSFFEAFKIAATFGKTKSFGLFVPGSDSNQESNGAGIGMI